MPLALQWLMLASVVVVLAVLGTTTMAGVDPDAAAVRRSRAAEARDGVPAVDRGAWLAPHSTFAISARSAATCALSAVRPRAVSATHVVRRPRWTPLRRRT